ncbi:raffinose synthase protein-like protein Sip1 [Pseudovirgaria hyperparasitica]|uniref:Raffinose synthase protein-like protein Sip1 n=1 Tax=Pseudovirgaria hyperparasitica TaxID=470096 RepID=A0A6A6VV02_9PEZI|nr:raffinose synthase protein-like protein Sip1 [Pseudovirgaria hyperparasitica]KAF2754392.1 raffinose synthase protein-like protein Sip1 [Pseudovirgaria hyperparasitica]
MFLKLVCDPPLGQITVVSEGTKALFTVLVETAADSDKDWSVDLWHDHTLKQWESLPFQQSRDADITDINKATDRKTTRRQLFTLTLDKQMSAFSFTIRLRSSANDSWKWARDLFGIADGTLLFQPKTIPKQKLDYFFQGISPEFTISNESSETPDTLLWYLTVPADAAPGEASSYTRHTLGTPTHLKRWFSLVRIWSPWLAPRQGTDHFDVDKDSVLSSFLREDGYHVVVLAISGTDDVLTIIHHDGDGNVVIQGQNDAVNQSESKVVVAVGHTFELANSAAMYHARKVSMQYEVMSEAMQKEVKALEEAGPEPQWLQEWYDGLTYCTWNGLGQKLHQDRIFEALESLRSSGITITNLIIDDNWQSLGDNQGGEYTPGLDQFRAGWMEFEAIKEGFPQGLKYCTSKIRKDNPNIKHIAVWHALLGYWGGIAPHGKIAKEYGITQVHMRDGVAGGNKYVVPADQASRMYADFYSFLSQSGVDSVKTDAQFMVDEIDQAPARRSLIKEYQDSWSIANMRYLGAKAISCMSLTPQMLFHSQLPNNKPRLLLRNSDDFFPEIPASHPWHIFCNAHVSLLTQHLNTLPDWDMFQTVHDFSAFHAAARCVSGGPIYITDEPGKHDIKLIDQMTAKNPRGDTIILRPSTVGKSTNAYTSYDEHVLLKVSSYNGGAQTGTSILGIFNTTSADLTEHIKLSQFPGAETGTYIIRSYTSGSIAPPLSVASEATNRNPLYVSLNSHAWDILSAVPVQSFTLRRKGSGSGPADISIANLGLLDKMTGSAAIVNTMASIETGSGRLRVYSSLKALGIFGLYVSGLGKRNVIDDFFAVLFGVPVDPRFVKTDINDNGDGVLEIDVAAAYKDSGKDVGWSNEIGIEVIVR